MKCPWKPKTITVRNGAATRTEFGDCYKGECPFYLPECKISENLSRAEGCQRTNTEHKKGDTQK